MSGAMRLFSHELREVYGAERKLARALARMIRSVDDSRLAEDLARYREATRRHVARLERIFEMTDSARRVSSDGGIDAVIASYDRFSHEHPDAATLDAFAAGEALRAEHYEIAAYTSLIGLARAAGCTEALPLLADTLAEKRAIVRELEREGERLDMVLELASHPARDAGVPPSQVGLWSFARHYAQTHTA